MKPSHRLPGAVFVASAILSIVGTLAVTSLTADSYTQPPPFGVLLLAGSIVILLVVGILSLAIRMGLSLRRSTVGLVLGFNILIVITKFIIVPYGLYQNNSTNGGFDSTDIIAGGTGSFWWTGISGLIIYLVGLALIVRIANHRNAAASKISASAIKHHRSMAQSFVGLLVLIVLIYAGAQFLVIPFLFVVTFGQYLQDTGPYLALILICATIIILIALRAFRQVSNEAKELKNAALLSSVTLLCASLIVLEHVLWVIFMSALVTIWPFKTFISNTK